MAIEQYKNGKLEYVQGLVDEGDKFYQLHKDDIDKAKDHFKLTSDHLQARKAIEGRHSNYFPELHPAIRSRVASFLEVLRSGDPAIKLAARNNELPGAGESAKRLEDYVKYCYEEGKLWTQWYFALLNAEMYPYAPVYIDWEDRWAPVPFFDGEKLSLRDWIVFSGPKIYPLQPQDYRGDLFARSWPQLDPDAMKYHFMIKDVSKGYLLQGHKDGRFPLLDPTKLDEAQSSTWANKRRDARMNEGYQKPESYNYELIQGQVRVYDDEAEREVWRVVTLCGEMLLDEKPYKYSALGPSYVILSSEPLPGEVAGMSTSMLGEKTQNLINELWNQRIEANEQAIFSPTFYKGEMTSDPTFEPMALCQVGDDFESFPFPKNNLSGSLIEDIRFLEERNQQNLASYDTMQPVMGKSKQTLGEYKGKQEAHNTILGLTAQMYADAIVYTTKMAMGMATDRLPDWIELGLFGDNPVLNSLQLQDLATDLTIEIPKVKSLAMEEMNIIKWENLYEKLMTNPLVMSDPAKVHEVTRRYLEAVDEKATDKLIGESPAETGGLYAAA